MTFLKTNITFLFVIIVITSCSDSYQNRETIYIDQLTNGFIGFKPGTWWLYKNLKNNTNDTWKLNNIQNFIIPADEANPYNYERTILIISTNYRDTFKFLVSQNNVDFATQKHNGLNQICYFHNDFNSAAACDNNRIKLLSTDSLNGKITHKEFGFYPAPCTNLFPNHLIWELNRGIIKMSYPSGDTLILINQNIIR